MRKVLFVYILFFIVITIAIGVVARFLSYTQLLLLALAAIVVGVGLWIMLHRKYAAFAFITAAAVMIIVFISWIEVFLIFFEPISDYIPLLRINYIEKYAASHDGYYPIHGDVWETQSGTFIFGKENIFNDFPIEWTRKRYYVNGDKNLMMAWNSKSYGHIMKWRAVIFVGGEDRLISERDFKKLFKEQQGVKLIR
jgi:hypothetical protein